MATDAAQLHLPTAEQPKEQVELSLLVRQPIRVLGALPVVFVETLERPGDVSRLRLMDLAVKTNV